MGNVTFRSSIFADTHDRAITSLYKLAYFVGLIFVVHESTMKTVKVGPLENFPLYDIHVAIVVALLFCPKAHLLHVLVITLSRGGGCISLMPSQAKAVLPRCWAK